MDNDLFFAILPYPVMLILAVLAMAANGHKLRKQRAVSDYDLALTVYDSAFAVAAVPMAVSWVAVSEK